MLNGTVSATESGSKDWQLAKEEEKKPASLLVQLRNQAYILPYFRFFYAEGNNSLVKVVFASHLVTVTGNGLAALLAALASQAVLHIIQPTENEANFGVRGASASAHPGPSIHDISIEEFK